MKKQIEIFNRLMELPFPYDFPLMMWDFSKLLSTKSPDDIEGDWEEINEDQKLLENKK